MSLNHAADDDEYDREYARQRARWNKPTLTAAEEHAAQLKLAPASVLRIVNAASGGGSDG